MTFKFHTHMHSHMHPPTETHTLFPHVILPPLNTQNKAQGCKRLAAAGSVMKCSNETLQQAEGPMNKTLGACLSEVWALVSPHHYSFTQQSPH